MYGLTASLESIASKTGGQLSTGSKKLDFLVIGAQKSGTTSLYRYLSSHPEIYMPPEKEIAFFSDAEKLKLGSDFYLNEYFANAQLGTTCGEASPQYMTSGSVPLNIAGSFPNAKVIAILRNPIDRAYSHYRMAVRRQITDLCFDDCVKHDLQHPTNGSFSLDMERDFLHLGEYSRILTWYLKYFPREQIKIVFTEDLAENPDTVMNQLFEFIGVDPQFQSIILGDRFHEGGIKRFNSLEKLSQLRWVKKVIRGILPAQLRRRLGFWFVSQVVVVPTKDSGPSDATRQKLVAHFRSDVDLLEKMFEAQHPWHDFMTKDKSKRAH